MNDTEDNEIKFSWQSEIKDEQMRTYQEQVNKQLNIVSETLQSNIPEVRDEHGALILNATKERLWFRKNVAFIFGIGAIYDEEDEAIMNTVLSMFNDNRDGGYFGNHYQVESYENSALIQEIEKKLKIGNGNYHVFLAPVVYAKGDELKQAPEAQFTRFGIVNKFMKWQTITEYLQSLMAKYGLITELFRQPDPQSWEIGQEGLAAKKGPMDDVECKFDIDIDPDGRVMMEIEKNLEAQRDLHDNYNNRVREGKSQRDGVFNNKTQTRNKRKSLYQQMYEEKRGGIVDTVPDSHVGVELRLNERFMPESKKVTEYQLYDDDGTYVDGRNKIDNETVEVKYNIPKFRQTNVRGSGARVATLGGYIK